MDDLRTDEEAWAVALENEGLANKICRSAIQRGAHPRGVDFDWLKSHAWEGLFKAAKKWDPEVAKFSTYAYRVMKNEMARAMMRHEAAQGGPRSYDLPERAAFVGSIEADADFLASRTEHPDDPIEPPYLASEDPGFEEIDDRLSESGPWIERLEKLLVTMSDRDQAWVRERLEGRKFAEIAKDYGSNRQRVQQVFKSVIEQLREQADEVSA